MQESQVENGCAVRLLVDINANCACLYDMQSGIVFGPLISMDEANPAEFLSWLRELHGDPRQYNNERLKLLLEEFKCLPVNNDGWRPVILRNAAGETMYLPETMPNRF